MLRTSVWFGAAILVSSCAGPSIIGKWSVSGLQSPPGSTTTLHFGADDNCELIMVADLSKMGFPVTGNVTATLSGSYKLDGEMLTTTFRTVSFATEGVEGEQGRALETALEGQKPVLLSQMQTAANGTVKWEGNDRFIISADNVTITCQRVP